MKRRRIVALIIISAMIICAVFSAFASYAVMDISLGVNDSLVEPPGGIRPVFVDNVCYVPIEVFTNYFSLTYSYDGVSRTLSVFGGAHTLSFNIRQNIATNENLEVYYATCYYDNSTFMVPARVMCEAFGLRYSFISSINTVRIRLSAANLSDKAFADKYINELIPPQPNVPNAGNDGDVSEETHTPDVYLMFVSPSGEKLDEILDTLDNLGVSATFFLSGQFLSDNPKDAAKIIAGGHELGMDLSDFDFNSEYTTQSLLGYVNGVSLDIARLYKVNTNAVYITDEQNGKISKNAAAALAEEGYKIWVPKIAEPSNVYSVTNRLVGNSRFVSVSLKSNDNVSNMIRGIANYVFEKDASFNTIKLTSKP